MEHPTMKKLVSFGSLNTKLPIKFSCVSCGLHLYNSLVQ